MKELTVGKLKAQFSNVIDDILSGEEYTILKGRKKAKVAIIIPYNKKRKKRIEDIPKKRSLGKDKGKIIIKDDFDELPEDILKSFGIE